MKVLVVSHNPFNYESNMGKTLSSYFSGFNSDQIAQFFVCDEKPDFDICSTYYRVTDKEALKSIFTKRCGNVIKSIDEMKKYNLNNKSVKKNAIKHFSRDFVWNLSNWFNKKLKNWVNEFKPDIVFLASGDYGFIYKVALKIAKFKKIPLVINCMDDYYINNQHIEEFLGKKYHRYFMKTVVKTVNYSSCIFTICDMMKRDYSKMFNKNCYTLHTATSVQHKYFVKENFISYVGNLSLGRASVIAKIGKSLNSVNLEDNKKYIDVYSRESNEEILKLMIKENNIRFHGAISAADVPNVLYKSEYLLHVESFEKKYIDRVKYSVSTKIPDSLASGRLLIAVGPQNIASISYLQNNNLAYVINNPNDITIMLNNLISNDHLKSIIIDNSLNIVEINHRERINKEKILKIFNSILNKN